MRITILTGGTGSSPRNAAAGLDALVAGIHDASSELLPHATLFVAGYRLERDRLSSLLVHDQSRSIAIFFVCLFVVLFVIFRDIKWVLFALIPSAVSVTFFYGLAGWSGLALSAASASVVATIMGVSVDDVVYLTLFYRRERETKAPVAAMRDTLFHAGHAAFQTTLIICVSVTPLVLSRFSTFSGHALLLIGSLATATFCTLRVVPWFIERFGEPRSEPVLGRAE